MGCVASKPNVVGDQETGELSISEQPDATSIMARTRISSRIGALASKTELGSALPIGKVDRIESAAARDSSDSYKIQAEGI